MSRKHFKVFQETVLLESRHCTKENIWPPPRKLEEPSEKNDSLAKKTTASRKNRHPQKGRNPTAYFVLSKNDRPRTVHARGALFSRESVLRVFGPPQRYAHAHGNTVLDDEGRPWQRTVLCGSLAMDKENWVRQWSVSQIWSIGKWDCEKCDMCFETGLAFSTCPTCRVTALESNVFRMILLRRLQMPLPLTVRTCRCGRPLDAYGHHRAACARVGVLGRRGYAVENVAARICREAGGRVTTNAFLRDLDLDLPQGGGGRRLEVVVDGLPLFGGAQLAVDTTLVSALHGDGTARRRAADEDGVVLAVARRTKEARYPELVGPRARARLVVLGVEVGGRWSGETQRFVSLLVRAKARSEVWLLRRRAEQAWRLRWGSLLSCTVARAVAQSLLNFLALQELMGTCRLFMRWSALLLAFCKV